MFDIITFIGGSSVAAFLLVEFIKRFVKDTIAPRFSDLIVLLVLLVISLGLALFGFLLNWLPDTIFMAAQGIFISAIVIYQVLYKAVFQKAIRDIVDKDEK